MTLCMEQVVKIKSAAEAYLIMAKKVGGSTEAAAQVLQLCETIRLLDAENKRLRIELGCPVCHGAGFTGSRDLAVWLAAQVGGAVMPREIGLPLSEPMVLARKAGRKTQTRCLTFRGQPGDIIWWREGLMAAQPPRQSRTYPAIAYAADGQMISERGMYPSWRWQRNVLTSIFMPRWACRFRDVVTDIRRERLQDILYKDCVAEGFDLEKYGNYDRARFWYRDLWDSLNGKKHPWESNPEVVVVTFQPV